MRAIDWLTPDNPEAVAEFAPILQASIDKMLHLAGDVSRRDVVALHLTAAVDTMREGGLDDLQIGEVLHAYARTAGAGSGSA